MVTRILLLAVLLIGFSGVNGFGQYSTHYYLQKNVFESMPDTDEVGKQFYGHEEKYVYE